MAAIKGYKIKLIMPADQSEERKAAMAAFVAELISVPSSSDGGGHGGSTRHGLSQSTSASRRPRDGSRAVWEPCRPTGALSGHWA
ncbi:hypothetical protein WJX77_010824 [Trebouxia sp. C0004]